MSRIFIKPLSVNEAWQGKRFKTEKYKSYEKEMLLRLPSLKLPQPPYEVFYRFGMSNTLSDWDNPIKPFQDILQKKYDFDDKLIFKATIEKVKVSKGEEFIEYEIKNYLFTKTESDLIADLF